jgi:hypothetical protein
MAVIDATLQVVTPMDWNNMDTRRTRPFPTKVGCLELLYHETEETLALDRKDRSDRSSSLPATRDLSTKVK